MRGNYSKLIFYACIIWHIFFFFFIPHLIELPGLLESWWTYKGLIYYKDFATFHFPLGRLILLPFYIITNWNLHTGPILGLVTNIISVTLIYKFGQKFFNKTGNSISIIFFTLFSWYLGTAIMFYHEMLVGLVFLIAFYYFAKKYSENYINRNSSFLLGILVSLSELSGQIITPTIITFAFIYGFFLITLKKTKHWAVNLISFLIGSALPIGLLSLYFITSGGFNDFFEQNFLYYTTYAGTYEKLPFLSLPLFELFLFYFPFLVSSIYFIYAALKGVKIKFLHLISTILLLSSGPFILFSVFHFHHVSFALPIASIVVGFTFSEMQKNKHTFKLSPWIFYLFLGLLIFRLVPWYLNTFSFKNLGRIANNMTNGDTMHKTVEWVKKNTSAESTILVAGDALFYFSANRDPSSKHAYVSPYNWEPLRVTFGNVVENSPDYWVINTTYFTRLVKEYKKRQMVDFIEYNLANSYIKAAVFDDWEIWEKTGN